MSGRWIRAGASSDIEPGQSLLVVDAPHPVALFRTQDGELVAYSDLCTHEESSLTEEGYIDGDKIVCGWHAGYFCLRTGAATRYPAIEPLKRYAIELRGDDVYVDIGPAA